MRYDAGPPRRRIRPRDGRIGIPRSLAYDELRVFFDHLLGAHGFELVRSPPTTAITLERGSKLCVDEVCFPLKTFYGHVAALADAGVDTVLVPRLVSLAQGRNLCPKFAVLPDLVEAAFDGLHVLAPYVDLHHARRPDLARHLRDACRTMLRELGAWSRASNAAVVEAFAAELAARRRHPSLGSKRCKDAAAGQPLRVAVVGHRYAERDPFLGVGVIAKLRRLGALVVTSPASCPEHPVPLEEGIYYEPSVRAARAIEAHLDDGVDGIVLLTYFACGPDSYAADTFLYRLEARAPAIPVLRLVLDEQTSSEGLVTRLDTFVEVARHQRRRRAVREGQD